MQHLLHQFKLSVRRYKAYGSIGIETFQTDTWMKMTIIKFDSTTDAFAFRLSSFPVAAIEYQFVVQAEFAFWSSTEIGSHHYVSVNVCSQDAAYLECELRTGEEDIGTVPLLLIRRFTVSTTSTNA